MRPSQRREEWVEISEHAYARWAQRAGFTKIGPRVAWFDAETIDVDDDNDELRYHALTGTVLCRKEDTITTVLDATTARSDIVAAVAVVGGERA